MSFLSARNKAGLTQSEAGLSLGVATAAISQWEQKKTYPDPRRLLSLAELYECTVDELLEEEAEESCYDVRGIIQVEGSLTLETVGFVSLWDFVRVLKEWKITGKDRITVHIQRGDGAEI